MLRILGNIPCQLEILRLMKYPVYAEILPLNPRFAIKFAADDYLVRDISVPERKTCFIHHYTRLRDILPDSLLHRILHQNVCLYEFLEEETKYRVTAHLSRPWDKEGELSFNLELNGVDIYVVSFSIVPGSIVKSRVPEVILISRLQGMKGKYRLIQCATKAMNDVAPSFLLLAALQGFGEAFDIREIVGVSAVRQSAYSDCQAEIFQKAYDDFFNDLGAVMGPENLFTCPIPIPDKPLTEIKRGHKLRTKEKRAFKRQVIEAVRRFFQTNQRTADDRSFLGQRRSDIPA